MLRKLIAACLAATIVLVQVAPATAAEVPVLQVGDIVVVTLPGEDSLNKPIQIDRDGRIEVPEAGAIAIAGMPLPDARKKVAAAMVRVYRDLGRFDLVLRERRLSVTVLGYVKQPGSIDLPGGAGVQQALNTAGGLQQGAQLDRMQLRRGKRTVVFDYKKYLDTGDSSLLPALEPLDTIFVPVSPLVGNVQVELDARTLAQAGDAADDRNSVKVFGEVQSAGSFAFRPGSSVVDLIMRAGGVTRYAAVEQIRVISRNQPAVFNLKRYLDSGDKALLPEITAGATIFVPKEVEEIRMGAHVVYVMGEVFKPGAFETKKGASFLDILANAGGPTRFADTRTVRVMKADGSVQRFNLQEYVENPRKGSLPRLQPGDAIFVSEKTQANGMDQSWLKIAPNRSIRIMGAVKNPGRYEWSGEMSILDIVAHAGGPTDRADTSRVQILVDGEGGNARPTTWDMAGFLKKGGSLAQLPRLKGGSSIIVPEIPAEPNDNKAQWTRQPADRSIYIMGQVGKPGRYAFDDTMRFLDILAAADGPTGSADIHNIRVSHRTGDGAKVSKLNLALYFETGDERLIPAVVPGDVIFVPEKNRQWIDEPTSETVRVLGSVGKPGRYRFTDGMSILDLLAEAGGPTGDAYQEKIVVVNFALGGEQARTFDLVAFAKKGDASRMPVIRAGDTVYVPNVSQSDWRIFMDGVRDAVSILSIFALVGRL